jgi:hypothetical protein
VIELAWFAAGAAATAAATILLRARGGKSLDQERPARPNRAAASPSEQPSVAPVAAELLQEPSPHAALPAIAAQTTPSRPTPRDARAFAVSLAEELASLASGVEGRAHALIECAPHREMLPAAAEGLLAAILRLRTLHRKLVAFGQDRGQESGSTNLGELVSSLTDELQHMQLGIELRWDPPPMLPSVAANREVVREALLFLCSALLRAERGATRLSIAAELCLAETTPTLHLELALEWVAECHGANTDPDSDVAFSIEHEAAANLLRSQGGEVAFTHLPGRSACALVCLPALVSEGLLPETTRTERSLDENQAEHTPVEPGRNATETPPPAPEPMPQQLAPQHRYGGALVLESDPSVRAMLASELKATGRAVFACADGASARSFLAATPERFEVLIVDHQNRLEEDDALGKTIRLMAPGLKICVLSPKSQFAPGAWPQAYRIEKPFGVHELRTALASVLAGG